MPKNYGGQFSWEHTERADSGCVHMAEAAVQKRKAKSTSGGSEDTREQYPATWAMFPFSFSSKPILL